MAENAIKALNRVGHAVWLAMNGQDDPAYDALPVFVAESGISGMVFSAKAILGALTSGRCDARLQQDLAENPEISLQDLLVQQLRSIARRAADALLPVYDDTAGRFGHVVMPIPPNCLNHDSRSTTSMQEFHESIARPNVRFSIEASDALIPVIRQLTRNGIPFVVKRAYTFHDIDQVLVAYMNGLTDRIHDGKNVLSSHCGFMMNLSELDQAVDDLLPVYSDYKSLTAIALGKRYYTRMLRSSGSQVFHDLVEKHGALIPHIIFRSAPEMITADIKYVRPLIGRDVVSCVNKDTLQEIRDMENHEVTIMEELLEAEDMLDHLEAMHIDMDAMANRIKQQTMQSFQQRFDLIMSELDQRRNTFLVA